MQAWVDDPGGSDDADVQGFSYPGVPDLPESWALAGNAFVAIRTRLGPSTATTRHTMRDIGK
jgi:hypothetical protein